MALEQHLRWLKNCRKIPAPIEIKSALPTPAQKPKIPPPLKRGVLWAWGFPAERKQKFQAPIKLVQPFPALELRTNIFTDTGLLLRIVSQERVSQQINGRVGKDIGEMIVTCSGSSSHSTSLNTCHVIDKADAMPI